MHKVLERQLRKLGLARAGEVAPSHAQWRQVIARVDRAYTEADQDRYTLERALELSSSEMQRRFAELRRVQGELVETSRKAGMADVAANVIHNVGNVLNSVNVSASIVAKLARTPTSSGVDKAVKLLRAQPQPGRFLDEDPRGPKLIEYLATVSARLRDERDEILRELDSLTKNIDHIKAIVSEQQSSARPVAVIERIALTELLDDAVKSIGLATAAGRAVDLDRDYQDPLVVEIDKHKVFQVLVNLLSNARDAVRGCEQHPRVTIRARALAGERVVIEVEDNGVGIVDENLTRIFNHGFTTKPDGHGFGLHSSSCSTIEMDGTLTAHSDGPGCGARFTLVLPRMRVAMARAA
jgi:two-component system NtrC family sensor kinase